MNTIITDIENLKVYSRPFNSNEDWQEVSCLTEIEIEKEV